MTRLDRYVLLLFLRTTLISFCSLAGVFIVFHAFMSMDDLIRYAKESGEGMPATLVRFFGPYMLLLFDWTGAIVALMALLFSVGWLRRSGELTAMLSAGVSHGRILQPILVAVIAIILFQLGLRELVIPKFRDSLTMRAQDLGEPLEQPVQPTYDRAVGILIAGRSLTVLQGELSQPNLTVYADYPGFGDVISAEKARWYPAGNRHPAGFLLQGVVRPLQIDRIPSVVIDGRPVLLTASDQSWLKRGECFVATGVDIDVLQTNPSATKLASVAELSRRVRNPAIHSSASLRVLLHERILRPPLDLSLVLVTLPLIVNRRGKGLFVLVGGAIGIVLVFFGLKTVAGTMGGSGYLIGPAMAAWIPLLVLGPFAYVRFREVQTV